MMVQYLSRREILFKKNNWTEEDLHLARCLGMKETSDGVTADVRIVPWRCMKWWFRLTYKDYVSSITGKKSIEAWMVEIKAMYKEFTDIFIEYALKKLIYTKEKPPMRHQLLTLAEMFYKPVGLYALDMGLGKTFTSASLSTLVGCPLTVIVLPATLKWNWIEDLKTFGYNELNWSVLDPVKSRERLALDEKFICVNYEQVGNKMNYLLKSKVNHIVVDECQYLKNVGSQRSKNFVKFLKAALKANPELRITFLSGTPMTKNIVDMYSYLKYVSHPLITNKSDFEKKYTIKENSRSSSALMSINIDHFRAHISSFMLRMKSESVLDLPDLIVTNLYLDIKDLSEDYELELDILRDRAKAREELEHVVTDDLSDEERKALKQEKFKITSQMRANIHTLNRICATSKVKAAIEMVQELLDSGEEVVIFSNYTDPLKLLEAHYGDTCVLINGDVDPSKRQPIINDFVNNPEKKVFLGNMSAAGIGINLVNAKYVVMLDFPFTPDKIQQAQKRLHRKGQKHKVNAVYLIARETIDQRIYELWTEKAINIAEVIDGNSNVVLSNQSIEKDLIQKLLA